MTFTSKVTYLSNSVVLRAIRDFVESLIIVIFIECEMIIKVLFYIIKYLLIRLIALSALNENLALKSLIRIN